MLKSVHVGKKRVHVCESMHVSSQQLTSRLEENENVSVRVSSV